MRELNFRIGGKQGNGFRYLDKDELFNLYRLNPYDGSLIVKDNGRNVVVPRKAYVIEQYTGLKDKNGKEIYEGDIVKCGTLEGCPAGVIVFRTEDGCYEVDDPLHTFGGEHFGELYANRMGVIGNIHENKELLETKNDKMGNLRENKRSS